MKKTDEELTKSLVDYEKLEKQLEILLIQKHQLQLQINETKHALEETKKAKGEIYRQIGSVLIKKPKEEVEQELKGQEELLEVKLNAISKQEERLRETVVDTQKKLQEKMKDYGK